MLNVQNALDRLSDVRIPSNLSSTPEQILSAYLQVLEALTNVEGAAVSRDHQLLIQHTKRLVAACVDQSEHSKGVCQLTDDAALSEALGEASKQSAASVRQLLITIKEDPYDADPILVQCETVREHSNALERATQAIINAEKVSGAPDLTDKASSELMRAAQVIEDAAKALLEAKRLAEEKAKEAGK